MAGRIEGKLEYPDRKKSLFYPRLYVALAVAGLLAHSGAAALTLLILKINIGMESNPLFYLMGGQAFLVFGVAGMLLYYFLLWKTNVPMGAKCVCASVLTATAAFDFSHDLSFYLVKSVGLALGIHV